MYDDYDDEERFSAGSIPLPVDDLLDQYEDIATWLRNVTALFADYVPDEHEPIFQSLCEQHMLMFNSLDLIDQWFEDDLPEDDEFVFVPAGEAMVLDSYLSALFASQARLRQDHDISVYTH